MRAGVRRGGDVRGRRAEGGPVPPAGAHAHRRHVPRQEEGQAGVSRDILSWDPVGSVGDFVAPLVSAATQVQFSKNCQHKRNGEK